MFKRVHALRLCALCSEENRIIINILIYFIGRIIKLIKESINRQKESDFEMKSEFKKWDSLSDEALINFESNL